MIRYVKLALLIIVLLKRTLIAVAVGIWIVFAACILLACVYAQAGWPGG